MPETQSRLIEKYFKELNSSNEGLTQLEAYNQPLKYGLNSVASKNQLDTYSDYSYIIFINRGSKKEVNLLSP